MVDDPYLSALGISREQLRQMLAEEKAKLKQKTKSSDFVQANEDTLQYCRVTTSAKGFKVSTRTVIPRGRVKGP